MRTTTGLWNPSERSEVARAAVLDAFAPGQLLVVPVAGMRRSVYARRVHCGAYACMRTASGTDWHARALALTEAGRGKLRTGEGRRAGQRPSFKWPLGDRDSESDSQGRIHATS